MTGIFNCAVLLNAFSSDADHADSYIIQGLFAAERPLPSTARPFEEN